MLVSLRIHASSKEKFQSIYPDALFINRHSCAIYCTFFVADTPLKEISDICHVNNISIVDFSLLY